MEKPEPPVVKRSLYSWIFSGNMKLQILLLVIIIFAVFARVLPLEMQKRIVNEAIFLKKTDLLLIYCGIYLASVVTASGLKFIINILQDLISQRTLAAMRKGLYHHILTLPLNFFRKTQPGMVVSSLVTELASPSNFVGMAVAVPIINLLTLLAFAGYLLWLNPLLAGVSLAIYPLVLFLVPLLQKRVNIANKKRVEATRTISNKIGETITGIHEIQGNGAYQIENKRFNHLADKLMKIRIVWTRYRAGIKITNNFFVSLGPFIVFILGGFLAIKGRLELGALVAFLSAQEKLYDPWKELIDFYQIYQDGMVNYKKTMDYFDIEPEYALEPYGRRPYELEANLDIKNLSFMTESGIQLLNGISFSLKHGEHLALVGFSGSGKSTLGLCIGQLYKYTGGNILLDDKEVSELSKKDMTQNMGFVSQSPFIFDGTIEENLLYSCAAQKDGEMEDPDGTLPSLDDMIAVLHQTGIFVDVLRFGLNTIFTSTENNDLVSIIIRIRKNFQIEFGKRLSDYVEFFAEDKYLYYSNVAENLTFGTADIDSFANENLMKNKYFLDFLNKADLTRPLLSLGAELSKQTVDILGNLPPNNLLFEQSPISPDELDEYKALVQRLKKTKLHQLETSDREMLLKEALRFTPGIHKMVTLPQVIENLILEGRAMYKERILLDHPGAYTFYDMSHYIFSQPILNNIFFGKMKTAGTHAQEKINQSIIQLLIEEDVLETIIEIGMQFQVGSKGDKLSGGQRQKLAIARVFLKQPNLLIMDEATSALDNKSQARIQNLLDSRWKGNSTLISVVHRLDIIKDYDKIAVMKAGKIGEMGTYDDLIAKKGMLYELIGGKQ
jgi:ABC-type multidrug transport system fused ATPase/permease subunit